MFSRMITTAMNTVINNVVTKSIPDQFNNNAIRTKGFYTLGDNLDAFKSSKYANTTFDYQLEHMDVDRIGTLNLAFDGTIFNRYTTGYRHLPGVKPPRAMPYFDPKINSTWQFFISTFLIEHAFTTLTDEAPVEIPLAWDFLNNPDLLITTDAVEALFPYCT